MKDMKVLITKVNVSLITKGGETPVIMKVNPNKRHSKNNTVVGFLIYKGTNKETIIYLEKDL